MTKIRYEIFGNTAELASFEPGEGKIIFSFSGSDAAHLTIAGRSYEINEGSASVPFENIPDGTHTPRLIKQKGMVLLPLISKSDGKISFPEAEGISRELSLRIARLSARLTMLEMSHAALDKYVKGTTCL